MTLNGSDIRDIGRVLKISTTTVIKEIKKACQLQTINQSVLEHVQSKRTEVCIKCIKAAEIDE